MICPAGLNSQMLSLSAQPGAKTVRTVRNEGEPSENGRVLGKLHFLGPGEKSRAELPQLQEAD